MTQQVVYDVGHSAVTQSWKYDNAGNMTQHIDFKGNTTLSTYDNNQLTTQTVDKGTVQVDYETFAYDANGNMTSHLDNDSQVTSSTYDGLGRLSVQTIKSGATVLESESWNYDANGNVTDVVDVVGSQTRETRYAFNALGQMTQELDGYGSGTTASMAYTYDAKGNLLKEIDAGGGTTQFAYNALGEETWSQNAMGNTATFQYDAMGRMTSEVDADGRLQNFTYDAFGREKSNVWFAGATTATTQLESISFGYDGNGNMTLASNSDGTYTLQYDPLNRVTFVKEPNGVSLTFGYDGGGNRTLEIDSVGGTVQSVYDATNELVTEIYTQTGGVGLQVQQDYNWQGQVSEQRVYNSAAGTTLIATNDYGYNAAGSVTNLNEFTGSSTIANYTLGYDPKQELTQSIDHGSTTNFAYDARGELTTYGGTTQTYTSAGNRSSATVTLGNEVTYDGVYSYTYDAEGNETSKSNASVSWSYSYDNQNHLQTAKQYTSGTLVQEADYKYDAFGHLVEEDVTTGSGLSATTTGTQYVIDAWNPAKAGAIGLSGTDVIADLRAGSGSLATHYVWGDKVGQLFGRYDAGGTLTADPAGIYFTLTDQNGSVRDIVNSSGTDVSTIQYDAFGNQLSVTSPGGAVPDPQDYVGRYTYDSYDYDAVTGYYDNNARVYDPASGRWLSQDPEGFRAGDSNLYRYVNNSPMGMRDPSGLTLELAPGQAQKKGSIQPWKLDANWKDGTGKLVYTGQGIRINMGGVPLEKLKDIRNEIWQDLKSFKGFSGPPDGANKNIASSKVIMHDGQIYVEFTTSDWLTNQLQQLVGVGDGPNGEVYVRAFPNDAAFTLSAVTLGKHMIVGIRQWMVRAYKAEQGEQGVSKGDNVINIFTQAWEQRNSIRTNVGFNLAGKKDMLKIWNIYLNNIAGNVLSKYKNLTGGNVGVQYYELPIKELSDKTNPLSSQIPDAKYRQP